MKNVGFDNFAEQSWTRELQRAALRSGPTFSARQLEFLPKDHCSEERGDDSGILQVGQHDHRCMVTRKSQEFRRESIDRAGMRNFELSGDTPPSRCGSKMQTNLTLTGNVYDCPS
jgi:hypothetical protein